jgi:hypothetical protein
MSRRCHHGSPRHARQGPERRRTAGELARRPSATELTRPAELLRPAEEAEPQRPVPPAGQFAMSRSRPVDAAPVTPAGPVAQLVPDQAPFAPIAADPAPRPAERGTRADRPPRETTADGPAAVVARTPVERRPIPHGADGEGNGAERGATGPQLRRFIKSRAYVPMHELRRRFAINGNDDEVTAVDLERHRVFVGLPDREGRLLAELLRGGDIGYELSLDPIAPIVVGVYPMRPVTRP